jgi:hypothetical protein
MWKLLKYCTGLSLMMNMPFIVPLASAMQTLFQRKDHQPPVKVQEPQKPPRVLVTYTGPETTTADWKRIYKRVTGRKTDVTVQKVGPQEYALAPQKPFERAIRAASPGKEPSREKEDNPRRDRRRGMQR